MASKVELELLVATQNATKEVQKFAASTQKQLEGISFSASFLAIAEGFKIAGKVAGAAFGSIRDGLDKAITEATEAENAISSLNNALISSGDFSEEASKGFQDFAEQLQQVTIYSDDAAISALVLAKQFQATNEEAKQIVRIAADVAARLGVDLNTAVFKVGQTLTGTVDRSLAKVVPGLKNLSTEAKIAGQGLDLISKAFAGAAAAQAETFSGKVSQIGNAFSNIFETFGTFIIQNGRLRDSLDVIKQAFIDFNNFLIANRKGITDVITEGFQSLIGLAPLVVRSIAFIDGAISTLVGSVQSLILVFNRLPTAIIQGITGSSSAFEQLSDDLVKLSKGTGAITRRINFFDPLIKQTDETVKKIKLLRDEISKIEKDTLKIGLGGKSTTGKDEREKNRFEEIEKDRIAAVTAAKQKIEQITKDPIRFGLTIDVTKIIDPKEFVAFSAGLLSNITKGADGAKKLVADTLGAVADTILPGIGGVVSEIVGVLSQGPEKVRETVRAFAAALPEVIKAIVSAIPVLIEELVNAIPAIIDALIEAIPELIEGLIRALPQVAASLAALMPQIAVEFSIGLIKNIPNIVEGFAKEFLKIPERFVNELLDKIPGGNILGGGDGGGGILGGIGDVFGGIGDFFGFADGGRVPDAPRFEGDRFPARLNAGEQVLSKDLSNSLERFLSGQGQSQPTTVVVQIGENELARILLDLNRRGFRTA